MFRYDLLCARSMQARYILAHEHMHAVVVRKTYRFGSVLSKVFLFSVLCLH